MHEREKEEHVDASVQLMLEIQEKVQGKRGEAGTSICPKCGNTVRYWTSTYNGHLRVQCDTYGCIEFVQ